MRNNIRPYKTASDAVRSIQPQPITGSNLGRVLPRQNSIGSLRGAQTVGFGRTKLDGANNTITVGSDFGDNGIGTLPTTSNTTSNQYGFFQTDASGRVIWKLVQGTSYSYNAADNYNNAILNGFAPDDGRPGIWVAKRGFSAEELLS